MFVPEIDVVSLLGVLGGHLVHRLDGPHGADFHAGLFATGPIFFQAISCTGAPIAFCGHISFGIPDDPARGIGTGFDAGSAPIAQSLVHNSDIAVIAIDMQCASGACLHAKGIGALSAYADRNVLGERLE